VIEQRKNITVRTRSRIGDFRKHIGGLATMLICSIHGFSSSRRPKTAGEPVNRPKRAHDSADS